MTEIQAHPEGKTKVLLNLIGTDGNAFAVMGNFQSAARKQGFNQEWVAAVLEEAKSGNYQNLLSTILQHTTTLVEESIVQPESGVVIPEDYKSFWSNEHKLNSLKDEIWEEFVPSSGPCIGIDGEPQPPLQLFLSLNRFGYDLNNNGLGNDKTEEAKYILEYFNLIRPFFTNDDEAKHAKSLFEFYLAKKEEEEDGPEECYNCDGTGYEEEEVYNEETEEYETEDVDCGYCNGNGYEEEEYFDWLHWFSGDKEYVLDQTIVASIYCILKEKEQLSPPYSYSTLNCWEHRKWKAEQEA